MDAVAAVACDDVAEGARAADRDVGSVEQLDAVAAVGQSGGTKLVQADHVVADVDPVGVDDENTLGGVAADGVVEDVHAVDRAGEDVDEQTGLAVGPGGGAAGIGADQVAVDDVAQGNAGAAELDAEVRVAGNDVAGAGAVAADGGAGATLNVDAVPLIGGDGAGRVQADAVALDQGGGRRAHDFDAVESVAGDDVAGACSGAADGRIGGRVLDEDAVGVRQQPGATEPESDDVADDLGAAGVALDLEAIGGDDLVA